MADAIDSVYSQHPNVTCPPVFNDMDEPPFYVQPLDVSQRALSSTIPTNRLVLINFSPGTDGTGLRKIIWKEVCQRKSRPKYTFTKCMTKDAGVSVMELPWIYQRNREYPFWLSPRGNGIDCHRTWEALYLDVIPIVWNSSLNVLYENLPVLIINDHRELNETFLREKLKEISTKKATKNGTYQYEKLRNAYWRRLILSKSRHRHKSHVFQRTNQCWRVSPASLWKSFMSFLSLWNLYSGRYLSSVVQIGDESARWLSSVHKLPFHSRISEACSLITRIAMCHSSRSRWYICCFWKFPSL